MRLLGIAKMAINQEPWTGNMVVQFRMVDAVKALTEDQVYDKYTVQKLLA